MWLLLYGTWACVLGCFILGRYPPARIAASASIPLAIVTPALIHVARRSERHHPWLGGALLWTGAVQNVMAASVTGGLHSPHTLVMFILFASLYARYGWSRRGIASLGVFCGAVVGMAATPRAWAGPVLTRPWFTFAAAFAMIGTLAVHGRFVGALRQSAVHGVRVALRARDELVEQASSRARELELVGSRLSHELKNPLAAIEALVQLTQRAATDPVMRKQLAIVHGEVARMAAVLQAHLGVTLPFDRVEPAEVELADLADGVLGLLDARARTAGVALERRGTARAAVDPQLIRGALVNLVANAIEACPRGARVEIGLDDEGGTIVLAVTDTGVGMAADVVARVGRPFFTTRQEGTGLGVALARAAVEQHGGTLVFRSVPGQGTTAIARLPREGSLPARSVSG